MNFEYKVGYLWKSPDEDPDQQKSTGRKPAETARTDGQPPERIYEKSSADSSWSTMLFGDIFTAFWTLYPLPWTDSLENFSFSFFLYLAFYSLPSFLSLRERKGLVLCDLKVFYSPDQKYYNWRSVQKVQDCGVQLTELNFCGFCSNSSLNSVFSKLSTRLQILAW